MKNFTSRINSKLIFFGIIILGFILRFYLLGVNPPSLDWDEASIGYNAYSILHTGRDEYGNFLPLSFRSFDDYKPPIYIYLTVLSVAVFGLTEFAVRFPAAIIGVLAIIVVYFFTKELFASWGKKHQEMIALLASFFLCVSPWHLQFSRAAFEGNVGMFFLILSLFCFLKAFRNKMLFIPFAFAFVLSLYSYHSFRMINPILLIVLFALFYKNLIKTKVFFVGALLIIIFLSLPIYMSLINPQGAGSRLSMVTIFDDPNILKTSSEKLLQAKQNNNVIGQIVNNRRLYFIPKIISGYVDHFRFDFLFLTGDGGVQHHAYNMGMLYLWDAPFILIGIYFLLKKFDKKVALILILLFLGPVPASITSGTPQPIRAIAMIPSFQILVAVGIYKFADFMMRKKVLGQAFILVVIFLFAINLSYYLYTYYILTPIKYGYFWQYGNKEAVSYAKKNENKYKRIIMTYEYDQPYIYYLFYNKIDPSWYQQNWNYTGSGEIYRFYRKIGKYEFRNITFDKDKELKNTLLIGTPKEITEGNVADEIRFPDGRVAYKLVENK